MPFRKRGSNAYRTRITLPDGRTAIRACGTTDKATARLVEGAVRRLAAERRWDILEVLYDRRLSLGDVYDAVRTNRLDALIARAGDVDLAPLVDQWETYTVARGVKCAAQYAQNVRDLIKRDVPFYRSQYTRPAISAHLAALDRTGATRNRHRSSFIQFSRWLVETGVLDFNPAEGIRGSKENRPRMVYYSADEAKAVLGVLVHPFRAIEAIMAGTGMEWAAVAALTARDVNLDTRTLHAGARRTNGATARSFAWKTGPGRCSPRSPDGSSAAHRCSAPLPTRPRSIRTIGPVRPPRCHRALSTIGGTPSRSFSAGRGC